MTDNNENLAKIEEVANSILLERRILEWRKKQYKTVNDIRYALKPLINHMVCSMCENEGYDIDFKTVCEIGNNKKITNYSGSVSSLILARNLFRAIDYVISAAAVKVPLTANLVFMIHHIVSLGVTKFDSDYTRKYRFTSKEACSDINGVIKIVRQKYNVGDMMYPVAILLAEFRRCQPLESFNKTVSRLLANYYLLFNQCPPIEFYNTYDSVLDDSIEASAFDDDLTETTDVLSYLLVSTYEDFIEKKLIDLNEFYLENIEEKDYEK